MTEMVKFYLPEDSKASLEIAITLTNKSIKPPNEELKDSNELAKLLIRNWIINNSQSLESYRMTKMVDNQPMDLNIVVNPDLAILAEGGTGIEITFPIGVTYKESLIELLGFINALNEKRNVYKFKNVIDLIKSIVTDNIAGIVVKDLKSKLMAE
jgi:hypothetical protein